MMGALYIINPSLIVTGDTVSFYSIYIEITSPNLLSNKKNGDCLALTNLRGFF